MEYFLGCLTTLIIMFVTTRLVQKNNIKKPKLLFSQSRGYSITEQYFRKKYLKRAKRQSVNFISNKSAKTVYMNDLAYWIENNSLYQAKHIDGKIIKETQKKVDIMSMDRVELKRMIFIVDKLTEGLNNDSGDSGH